MYKYFIIMSLSSLSAQRLGNEIYYDLYQQIQGRPIIASLTVLGLATLERASSGRVNDSKTRPRWCCEPPRPGYLDTHRLTSRNLMNLRQLCLVFVFGYK